MMELFQSNLWGYSLRSSRRKFLGYAAALRYGTAAERDPIAQFPSAPRDRLSVTSYPFRTLIESSTNDERNPALPGIDLIQFPAMIAEKFGVYNVNPLIAHFSSLDRAYLDKFRKALADARSHIVDLGLPGRQFYSLHAATRQSAVKSGKQWIDMATVIGSPSVRQHINGGSVEKQRVEMAADSLGQLAEYGKTKGIVVNLENDNAISEDPFFLVSIIEKVASPYLRGLPDFGNALMAHDEGFNEQGVTAMLKHAYNMCHVKDVVGSDSGKLFKVDLAKMFELAKAASYRGYFSMEYETRDGDPFAGTKRLVEETLQHLT